MEAAIRRHGKRAGTCIPPKSGDAANPCGECCAPSTARRSRRSGLCSALATPTRPPVPSLLKPAGQDRTPQTRPKRRKVPAFRQGHYAVCTPGNARQRAAVPQRFFAEQPVQAVLTFVFAGVATHCESCCPCNLNIHTAYSAGQKNREQHPPVVGGALLLWELLYGPSQQENAYRRDRFIR